MTAPTSRREHLKQLGGAVFAVLLLVMGGKMCGRGESQGGGEAKNANLTLPGSLATIIVIERAKGSASISFVDFLKVGLPTGVLSLVLGAAWLSWFA